jgi:hypothetical protein
MPIKRAKRRSCRSLSTSKCSTIESCAIPRWAIGAQ